MGVYLNSNPAATGTASTLGTQSNKLAGSQQRLATGTYSASDNSANAAVGFALEAVISSLTQASKNATQGSALLQYAMSTLTSSQALLNQMASLAAQANNTSLGTAQLQALNQNFQALLTQVDTNASNSWLSTPLFTGGAGTATSTTFTSANSTIASVPASMSNAFTASGFVYGQVTAASATSIGTNQYAVSMTIGSQTFQGEISLTGANTVSFTLASSSNPLNTVTLTTGSGANNTTITSAAAFTTALEAVFGVNTVTPQVLGNTLAGVNATTITSLSGGSASAGIYGLSYVAGTGGGTFTLSNGGQSWSQAVTSSTSSQTVTFGNGLSFSLAGSGTFNFANSFTNAATMGINVVAGTGNQTFTFQVGQAATNTVSVTFTGAGTVALGLTGQSIATAGLAQIATTAINAAINTLNNQIGTIGGAQDQLNYTIDNLTASIQNQSAAKSTFTDVDITTELINVQQLNAQITVSTSMFTQSVSTFSERAQLVQTVTR